MRTKIILLLAVAATAVGAPSALAADDHGDLVIGWASLTSKANDNGAFKKANRRAARIMKRSGVAEAIVDEVNGRWALPRDVPVLFSDLIPEGPFYVKDVPGAPEPTGLINFPGSFLSYELRALRPYLRDVKAIKPKDAMVAGAAFVLAHEIGHALVGELDLPVTGKEEDAVDGFAAYLLTANPRFGPGAALAAAMVFDATSDENATPSAKEYADEHSLGRQRMYQFLCWVYGSDPKEFKTIVGRGGLPRERAVRCADEWRQISSSWSRLLAPYEKPAG